MAVATVTAAVDVYQTDWSLQTFLNIFFLVGIKYCPTLRMIHVVLNSVVLVLVLH